MKLIRVEAHGFKSFADKVILNFDGGVAAIVGPNGSGKSNINDAIKWVLGEQSSKSLRGDSMEDVIFSGSKTVAAMNRAEVTLVFDNKDKILNIPSEKISLTRRISRGKGSNQYFINGELARLRDVKNITMQTGMSKSSLAIISQGTISNIAQATPLERRNIFEEAAGISQYKQRKLEALRKLEKTSESLEHIKTVVRELERQLNPLKKQADKARIYLAKSKELKNVEIGLIVEDVAFFSNKLLTLNLELESVVSSKEMLEERINKTSQEVELKTAYKLNLENDILIIDSKARELNDKLRNLEIKDAQFEQRRQMIIDGQLKTSSSVQIEAMKEQLEELQAKINHYNQWEEKATFDISEKKTTITTIESRMSILRNTLQISEQKLLKTRTKIDILRDHKENKSNLFQGTKVILENKAAFSGVYGIVADLFKVDETYKTAIESILQNALQHIVVDNSATAVKAINFLKNNRAGRSTFIPLGSIQPKFIRPEHKLVLESQNGLVGIGSELVRSDPKFVILQKFLLGNIIVVEKIEDANQISRLLNKRYMIVSLEGDIVRVGGVMSGGQKARSKNLLGVEEQIKKLESFIPIFGQEIAKNNHELSAMGNEVSEERSIITELYVETAKVVEKKTNILDQFNFLKNKYENQTKGKLKLLQKNNFPLETIELLESELSSIKATLKIKRDKIISINNELTNSTMIKNEMEKSLREIIQASSDKINQKNQAEFYVNSSNKRLLEEYQMIIKVAKEEYSLTIEREKAREIVTRIKAEIKELGYVNITAINDFKEVNQRFTKLKGHEEELGDAKEKILSAIDEMDQIIISKLDSTVKDVSKEFGNVFKIMFGGGDAEIRYTDPTNLLETGIDVIAQPPGKAVRNIKLFSGGEKAIIAISLLFAILKSKPLPLCILDEVEAALDEANVARYADFLHRLKATTQFIVITHRVGTMERMDHLFGATMQTRGVTHFFSVELKKAKTLINTTKEKEGE